MHPKTNMIKKFHLFHIVEKSPWPLLASLGALSLMISTVEWFTNINPLPTLIALITTIWIGYKWWRDVSKESFTQGNHTKNVNIGLQTGMILFITSEVLFFSAFFWAFFHRRISPTVELGQIWPPRTIIPFNPINVPLLNTLILISSGISITWAHHELVIFNKSKRISAIVTTVYLGILFSALQAIEYTEAPYTLGDSVFGSTFFIATGFHGLHVLIGTTFLVITTKRICRRFISPEHITGFECAAWYWHFVDVVWLFLYTRIYWWGSYSYSTYRTIVFQTRGKGVIKTTVSVRIIIALISALVMAPKAVALISEQMQNKWSPFECGFMNLRKPQNPLSIQFFTTAVLFLIFDIEISLLFPVPLEKNTTQKDTLATIFLIILVAGLFYEWKTEKLNWSVWKTKTFTLQVNKNISSH